MKKRTVHTVRQLTASQYSEKTRRTSSKCRPATVPKRTVVSFATKHYTKDITSPQQGREMMQLDYSEVHYAHNATFSLPTSTKTKREIGRCPCYSKQTMWLYQITVINVSNGYFASSESFRKMTRH